MKKPAWERCQFYSGGHCSQRLVIDKAFLTPQLLEPSHLQAIILTCENCEKHLSEKRQHQRIKRPFRVVIDNQEPKKITEGITVDISVNATRIKVDRRIDFNEDEVVQLRLHSIEKDHNQTEADITNLRGIIRRIESKTRELVILFLEEDSVKKCANI